VDFVLGTFTATFLRMRTEIRLIKIEPVPKCGTYEVRVSYYFDWEDDASRRLRPGHLSSAEALKLATARARAERDKPKV
jgi:hypothetical protein